MPRSQAGISVALKRADTELATNIVTNKYEIYCEERAAGRPVGRRVGEGQDGVLISTVALPEIEIQPGLTVLSDQAWLHQLQNTNQISTPWWSSHHDGFTHYNCFGQIMPSFTLINVWLVTRCYKRLQGGTGWQIISNKQFERPKMRRFTTTLSSGVKIERKADFLIRTQ